MHYRILDQGNESASPRALGGRREGLHPSPPCICDQTTYTIA